MKALFKTDTHALMFWDWVKNLNDKKKLTPEERRALRAKGRYFRSPFIPEREAALKTMTICFNQS